ncbi:MAG TPA: zf-HC2 domain-containing protein [Gemmatimonadales bacterium]|nr:zf-HC2 domain-containing protein [Gemmatimonadales bacterium]
MIHPSDWTCDRAARQFESYLLGTLVLQESLALAEHLEACPGCAQRLLMYRTTIVQSGRRVL